MSTSVPKLKECSYINNTLSCDVGNQLCMTENQFSIHVNDSMCPINKLWHCSQKNCHHAQNKELTVTKTEYCTETVVETTTGTVTIPITLPPLTSTVTDTLTSTITDTVPPLTSTVTDTLTSTVTNTVPPLTSTVTDTLTSTVTVTETVAKRNRDITLPTLPPTSSPEPCVPTCVETVQRSVDVTTSTECPPESTVVEKSLDPSSSQSQAVETSLAPSSSQSQVSSSSYSALPSVIVF